MMLPPQNLPDISTPTPAPLPDAPPPFDTNIPTPFDPAVQQARDDMKRKAASMAGYASTITTSGQGVIVPANTTQGVKSFSGASWDAR